MAVDGISIRRATASDVDSLTELAVRSKASWGYTDGFMAHVTAALVVSAEYVETNPVYILLRHDTILGFFGFAHEKNEIVLNDFWIEPGRIGTGLGRVMWRYALEQARANGYGDFIIHSDPNAEGFYLRMGAKRIGSRIAPESGRTLPLLRYAFTGGCHN
jgi:GNAT superfamily N-acetyltransferase